MKRMRLQFGECEHYGDLECYISDISKSGGVIIDYSVDTDEEVGSVTFEVPDKQKFVEEFRLTESFEFVERGV